MEEKKVEILSVPQSPDGRKKLCEIRDFLFWCFDGEIKKSNFPIVDSKNNSGMLSLWAPDGIKTSCTILSINYAIQKGITKDISYYADQSICDLELDTKDVKQYTHEMQGKSKN